MKRINEMEANPSGAFLLETYTLKKSNRNIRKVLDTNSQRA